jgi:hypothetical protein
MSNAGGEVWLRHVLQVKSCVEAIASRSWLVYHHLGIFGALARLAGLVRHEDVVTRLTQSLDYWITEILIRV